MEAKRERLKERNKIQQHEDDMMHEFYIRRYEDAYFECFGTKPHIIYVNGWYRLNKVNRRQAQFELLIAYLEAAAHEKELNAPEE